LWLRAGRLSSLCKPLTTHPIPRPTSKTSNCRTLAHGHLAHSGPRSDLFHLNNFASSAIQGSVTHVEIRPLHAQVSLLAILVWCPDALTRESPSTALHERLNQKRPRTILLDTARIIASVLNREAKCPIFQSATHNTSPVNLRCPTTVYSSIPLDPAPTTA